MQYEIESHKILILQPKCPLHLSFSKPVQEVLGNLKCFQVLCLLFSNKITSIPLFCSFTIHFDITQRILVEFFDGCMKPPLYFFTLTLFSYNSLFMGLVWKLCCCNGSSCFMVTQYFFGFSASIFSFFFQHIFYSGIIPFSSLQTVLFIQKLLFTY